MNGNERIGAESLFEPAFDIDGQLMGAEHAHPRIDADMGFDGDGGRFCRGSDYQYGLYLQADRL